MRFSLRTDNPAGRSHRLIERMELCRSTNSVRLDLSLTDPTGWPERADLERQCLSYLSDPGSNRYCPDAQGLESTRRILSEWTHGRVPAQDWFLCASTSEAYSILFQLLCDPGDKMVVNRPSYPLLDDLARHGGLGLVDVPLRLLGTQWHLDIGRLEQAFRDPAVKAFCLIQPGNPTGWFLSPAERSKVVALCAKHDVALISDEVFADYTYQDGYSSLLGETGCLTFALSGLSKGFGLPGFKMGWIAMSGPLLPLSEARERLQRLNDSLLSVSTPVQQALKHLIPLSSSLRAPIRSRLESNRRLWMESNSDREAFLPIPAGWMGVVRLAPGIEEAFCDSLLDQGILVQPGFLFDLPWDCVVVSLLTDPLVFQEGLTVLQVLVV
ncbi:MAG: pyridoxal phosphate-dependent aminotransferase [Fibrobacterota bacterium]